MAEEEQTTKESSVCKRRKRSEGLQTSNESLMRFAKHIFVTTSQTWQTRSKKEIKQKQRSLEEKNMESEVSLKFAHTSIKGLEKKLTAQELVIKKLNRRKCEVVNEEKQQGTKIESHSRRNNLNGTKGRIIWKIWKSPEKVHESEPQNKQGRRSRDSYERVLCIALES